MNSLRSAVVAAALLLIAGGAAHAETVKVGMIADFTGGMAIYGSQFQQAVQAYQAVNGNSVKGPNGETITLEFLTRDAASGGAEKVKQMAEELV